jgi:hypothetical protein
MNAGAFEAFVLADHALSFEGASAAQVRADLADRGAARGLFAVRSRRARGGGVRVTVRHSSGNVVFSHVQTWAGGRPSDWVARIRLEPTLTLVLRPAAGGDGSVVRRVGGRPMVSYGDATLSVVGSSTTTPRKLAGILLALQMGLHRFSDGGEVVIQRGSAARAARRP